MALTRASARYMAQSAAIAVSEPTRQRVLDAFVDTAACVLAGRDEPASRQALEWASAQARAGRSSIFFGDRRITAGAAAFVNAVAGHSLDYDDFAFSAHPSVVLVPAIWAEFERRKVRGEALCRAYVVGYELWFQLTRRLKVTLHERGWHPTPVIGTMCAAAGICAMREYDENRCSHALGLAAGAASGLVAGFGTMGKAIQVGLAAKRGIMAADLAERGCTGPGDGVEALLRAIAGTENVDLSIPWLTTEPALDVESPCVKKYPTCYATHRIIDALLEMASRHDIDPKGISAIHARVSTTALNVMKYHDPSDATEARFSLEFSIGCALTNRAVGLQQLNGKTLRDPTIRRLMGIVTIGVDDVRCPREPALALEDRVCIHFDDGKSLDSGPIRFARGHRERPLRPGELEQKLEECAGSKQQASAVHRALSDAIRRCA